MNINEILEMPNGQDKVIALAISGLLKMGNGINNGI